MIVGKIENGLERGFVKHRLNCLLITDIKGSSAPRLPMENTVLWDNRVLSVVSLPVL